MLNKEEREEFKRLNRLIAELTNVVLSIEELAKLERPSGARDTVLEVVGNVRKMGLVGTDKVALP